jgi:uncharacterized protein (DUF58 family)
MKNPTGSLYIHKSFFVVLGAMCVLFIAAHIWVAVFVPAVIVLGVFVCLVAVDWLMLYATPPAGRITAVRTLSDRFSNGDENTVSIEVENSYPFTVSIEMIDEIPVQFQKRGFVHRFSVAAGGSYRWTYTLRPVKRGEYEFGYLNLFATARIGFVLRRFRFNGKAITKVYPSYIQMRKYEIMAISNRLSEAGIKKIRKMGHHTEFDQINDYIKGDDIRTINWKATARRGRLMVNHYQDEKSQQIFCVIDMGRTMQMPFNGMTLLDYAINTSLVISSIAMMKHDKAGLITFNNRVRTMLPARREGNQMQIIMEALYKQETTFGEHNMEALFAQVKHHIHQRSFLILFTNYESLKSAERELPMLARLASNHLLMVIIFENTELDKVVNRHPDDTEEIYLQAMTEKFIFDKKQIVRKLERYGIHAILTAPENLTVDTLNRYLEFKARGII